jgi:hypothetical protein
MYIDILDSLDSSPADNERHKAHVQQLLIHPRTIHHLPRYEVTSKYSGPAFLPIYSMNEGHFPRKKRRVQGLLTLEQGQRPKPRAKQNASSDDDCL